MTVLPTERAGPPRRSGPQDPRSRSAGRTYSGAVRLPVADLSGAFDQMPIRACPDSSLRAEFGEPPRTAQSKFGESGHDSAKGAARRPQLFLSGD